MMMITAREIREKYPAPMSVAAWHGSRVPLAGGSYCVGGALCQFLGVLVPFPGPIRIAKMLQHANPELNKPEPDCRGAHSKASLFAKQITTYNDAEDFEAAWKVLDQALTYKGGG